MVFSVILPCYKPQEKWESIVLESFKELSLGFPKITFHLILICDGYKIEEAIINKITTLVPNLKIIYYKENRGKGYALRKGVLASSTLNTDYVILTDVDFPYQKVSLFQMVEKLLTNNFDVVLGQRDASYYKDVPKTRIYISKIFRQFITLTLGNGITDTQCGLKGFSRKAIPIFLNTKIDRYLFDFEFIYKLKTEKLLQISTVEAFLKPGIIFRKMGLKILTGELFNLIKIIFNGSKV